MRYDAIVPSYLCRTPNQISPLRLLEHPVLILGCSLSHTRGTHWQGWSVLVCSPVRATSKASSGSGPGSPRW